MEKTIITKNLKETKKLGVAMAKKILKQGLKEKAIIFGLIGDLGSGKTTFVQGLAKGLGVRQRITSPTFVIMKRFMIYDLRFKNFYHFDCYRIQKPSEILALGFQQIISEPKNIVAIEWAEKIKTILPKQTIWLKFDFIDENTRKIDENISRQN